MANPLLDFSHLTVAERIQLVEDLWDSIADAPEVLELSDAQRTELNRRLEALERNPGASVAWEAIRSELTGESK